MATQVFDQLLRRLPVRMRIIGGFMLIMLIAGSVSPIILSNFNSLVTRLEQFTKVDAKIERLLLIASRRVATSQLNLNRYIQDYVPSPYETLDDTGQAIQGLKDAQAIATDPEQVKTIVLIIKSLEDYQQQIADLQKAHSAGNNAEATRLESKLQKLGNDIGVRLELMVNRNVKLVAATNEEVLLVAQQSIGFGFLVIAIGFILAITLSILTSVSITRPLSELRAGAETFQKGDLVSKINVTGADEFTVIAQILNNLTKQLSELIVNLETRVAERTNDLETSNQRNERRAKQFEAISQVARTTTSIQNLETLQGITKLISDQFGFYHVGVFLMDDSREFAVLMAANSKGGEKMLARNHKLKVGQVGIVGYVTGSGNARVALDVGADAVHFDNPDLPDTRSELAMPLRIGGQIIGALDIQSLESNAFSQDDVQVFSTLADQIAVAIQNARSFEISRKLLHEAQSTISSYTTEAWQVFRAQNIGLGYQLSDNSLKTLDKPLEGKHIEKAIKQGEIATSSANNVASIAIPIQLRSQVIGVMNLQNPAGQAWDQDQIDIATAIAERLSLAIETATLLQVTQRRADIERVTSDISNRISSSTHFETILQTAAEELSRALGGSDVLVQIEPVSIKLGQST
jgi:GAF domain-containing protein/HAMP domain-containing protein